MLRQFSSAVVRQVGERQVRVRMSTRSIGRDRLIVEPAGLDLRAYRSNPIILWSHDPQMPVGRASGFDQRTDALEADVEFAPPGASDTADQVCQLVKTRIVNAVSIGFDPIDAEPVDPHDRRAGTRILKAELLECSFVSVPADRGAMVIERSYAARAAAAAVRRWASQQDAPLSWQARQSELEALSPALRSAAVRELAPRRPVYDGCMARWTAEMRDWLRADALHRAVQAGTPLADYSYAARQRDLALLTHG